MITEERMLKAVTAGNLKQRVEILDPVYSTDGYGNTIIDHEVVDSAWCYIEQHATQVTETTGEIHLTRKVIIAMRYRDSITNDTWFKLGKKIYRPSGPAIDACLRKRAVFVECVEEVKHNETA